MSVKRFVTKSGRRVRVLKTKSALTIAKKALREVNKIKKMVELKHIEQSIDFSSIIAGTAQLQHLTQVDSGDLPVERDGNMISVRSIQIRGMITGFDFTGTNENEVYRLMVWADKHSSVVATAMQPRLLTDDTVLSNRNPVFMNEFKVYWDKTITLANKGVSAAGKTFRYFEYFKRFSTPLIIRYDGSAGTSVEDNQLYFGAMVFANAAVSQAIVNAKCIIKYTDL